ncbi:MAG: hypothetical protein AB7N65_12890 [Vicinamibacterales bacterium]
MDDSPPTLPKVGPIECYYHALYHHVAHWTAYAASMVALLTLAILISSSSLSGRRSLGAFVSVFASAVAALYFINGMDTYGKVIREALPDAYRIHVEHFPHETTITLGRIAAVVLALTDLALLWWLSVGT